MKDKDIIGGVTPLKKRSQKFKAGDVGKKATRKNVKLKTGFQRSGMESEGGRNYESLTQGTRLTSSLADTLKFNQPAQPKYGGSSTFGEVPEVTVDDILGTDERQVTSTEKHVYERYEDFWDKRIGDESKWSTGMKSFIDKWKKNNPNQEPDLSKDGEIYKEWHKVSSDPENVKKRKKSREERTSSSGYTEYRDYKIENGKKTYTTDWYRK